jgi:predicted tellurium resistance membrane protein TerC
MDVLLDPVNLLALLTLTVLEIVLGIDNVVFIAIITDALPPERRNLARRLGLGLALLGRIGLVLGVSWLLPWSTRSSPSSTTRSRSAA